MIGNRFFKTFVFLAGFLFVQNTLVLAQDTPAGDADPPPTVAPAEAAAEPAEAASAVDLLREDVNVLWTCLAAFLVFFMQAGFALVESGFTRAKNACNIIMKNLMDFSVGTLLFWLVGFGLMFGTTSGYIGTSMFAFDAVAESGNFSSVQFGWAFLIFQTVFAATAATIVSGAVAGRTKYVGYLAYSVAITVVVYPIFGSWCWSGLVGATGQGWLEVKGFYDFAGSTVVHSVGGWAALAGAIVIGARKGKFKNGKAQPIPGHNIPLAALGVFILWLGWFGFNPGSMTMVGDDTGLAFIAVTTNIAAAAGAVTAMIASWIKFKKPDVSFALNGALAGLVSITAGCNAMSPAFAALTGAVGGVLVVFAVLFFEKLQIDDPVGAVSVHGVCGAWGTLAIGLFSFNPDISIGIQALGVLAGFLWAFPLSFLIFTIIKHTIGLRASAEDEAVGLDVSEHGMAAYPSQVFGNGPTGAPSVARKKVVKKKAPAAAKPVAAN